MSQILELLDYRRQVAEIYRTVRRSNPDAETWMDWRRSRDRLFSNHPQSPIEIRSDFTGLEYFDFDSDLRTEGRFIPDVSTGIDLTHSGAGSTGFTVAGRVEFLLRGVGHQLDVLWLEAYGGGLFIPFRDETNGKTTYGGGRYLLDTVKGADLGETANGLVLDFNYSYHPSCVHSTRWSCPLAPSANHLRAEVTAGERLASP